MSVLGEVERAVGPGKGGLQVAQQRVDRPELRRLHAGPAAADDHPLMLDADLRDRTKHHSPSETTWAVVAMCCAANAATSSLVCSLAGTSTLEQTRVDKVKPPPMARADDSMSLTGESNAMMKGDGVMMMAAKPGAASAWPCHRRADAAPVRCGGVAELAAAERRGPARQGRAGRLLDLLVHQLLALDSLCPRLAEKYKNQGLVVIGVHAPEFAFEKNLANVRKATRGLNIGYPVAVDNDFAIWRAFKNQFWPAHYFIDAQGRHHHFGEGEYDKSERSIQQLLAEVGQGDVPRDVVAVVDARGAQPAADSRNALSPETYVGYGRAENFAAPGSLARDRQHLYAGAPPLKLNQWALAGDWTAEREHAVLSRAGVRIACRFHARDLHLVLGAASDGKPVRFRVLIDGAPPLRDHGVDVDEPGHGSVSGQRLYQLIRQASPITDRLFEIEFLDPGAQAFAFTFG